MSAARTQSISGKWGCKVCDAKILAKAIDEHRIVLTFDLDFGDLPAVSGAQTPSVLLFRMRNQTPEAVTSRLMEVLAGSADALRSGALIVVEDRGYRVRHRPIRG